jgi:hypothetical protein
LGVLTDFARNSKGTAGGRNFVRDISNVSTERTAFFRSYSGTLSKFVASPEVHRWRLVDPPYTHETCTECGARRAITTLKGEPDQ